MRRWFELGVILRKKWEQRTPPGLQSFDASLHSLLNAYDDFGKGVKPEGVTKPR